MAEGLAQPTTEQKSPTLQTILKKGSSTKWINPDAEAEKRGGNPKHRTPKAEQGGWFGKPQSPSTPQPKSIA